MGRRVSDLLRTGGVVVHTSPEATVAEAVRTMAQRNVSSILVIDEHRRLVGIFTERDLLRRVVVPERDPATTSISEVMSRDVLVVPATTPRNDVLQIMDTQHIRHIPVQDENDVIGVISLRDVLRFENKEKEFEIEQLKQYVLQEPPATSSPRQGGAPSQSIQSQRP